MTKKHYQAVADILRDSNASQSTIYGFVEYFQGESDKFDSKRFLLACGA